MTDTPLAPRADRPRIDWRAVWCAFRDWRAAFCERERTYPSDRSEQRKIEELVERQLHSLEVMPAEQQQDTASGKPPASGELASAALAPCPCCGSARVSFWWVHYPRDGYPRCNDCGLRAECAPEADAIAAWNSRARLGSRPPWVDDVETALRLAFDSAARLTAFEREALHRLGKWATARRVQIASEIRKFEPADDDATRRVHGDSAERDAGYDADADPLHPLIGERRR